MKKIIDTIYKFALNSGKDLAKIIVFLYGTLYTGNGMLINYCRKGDDACETKQIITGKSV